MQQTQVTNHFAPDWSDSFSVSLLQELQISALPVKSTVLTKRWVRKYPPPFLFSLQKVYLKGDGNTISKYDKDFFFFLPPAVQRPGGRFDMLKWLFQVWFRPASVWWLPRLQCWTFNIRLDSCVSVHAHPDFSSRLPSLNRSHLVLKVRAKKRSFSALGRRITIIIILLSK